MPETFSESQATETSPTHDPLKDPPAEPPALTMSADDFSALEERIVRAVELVKQERQARITADERAAHAEAQLHEQGPRLEQLEKELRALSVERDHVRQRVERLLAQLDALEL
jgi:septal ring factor EnvC (AmiA/AmiB activator)